MQWVFDKNGNLPSNIQLGFAEFRHAFGFTEGRRRKIANLLILLKLLRKFGCHEVRVAGSFASTKQNPNDIDICVNITFLDYYAFKRNFPFFFTTSGIKKYKTQQKVDVGMFFDNYDLNFLSFFEKDRENNSKGLVIIPLYDIESYD